MLHLLSPFYCYFHANRIACLYPSCGLAAQGFLLSTFYIFTCLTFFLKLNGTLPLPLFSPVPSAQDLVKWKKTRLLRSRA